MVAIENGRVCVKKAGRDAGKLCVIMSVLDDKFAKILCIGRKKKRKCNIRHLEPTNKVLSLKESEEKLLEELKKMQQEGKW